MIGAMTTFLKTFIILLVLPWIAWCEDLTVLSLQGYLSKEAIAKALTSLETPPSKQLILEINSTSGDLNAVMDLAKRIYELKQDHRFKTTVYINDNAIGPAAILPFLADDLYSSLFVTWGAIPTGSENVLATNILRNRVVSLVNPNHPQSA